MSPLPSVIPAEQKTHYYPQPYRLPENDAMLLDNFLMIQSTTKLANTSTPSRPTPTEEQQQASDHVSNCALIGAGVGAAAFGLLLIETGPLGIASGIVFGGAAGATLGTFVGMATY